MTNQPDKQGVRDKLRKVEIECEDCGYPGYHYLPQSAIDAIINLIQTDVIGEMEIINHYAPDQSGLTNHQFVQMAIKKTHRNELRREQQEKLKGDK